MQNYKYNRSILSKFTIEGELGEDGHTITYINGDKEEMTMDIVDCFKPFRGEAFKLSLTTKEEQDLTDEFEEN